MFGWWDCCNSCSDSVYEDFEEKITTFSLPSPLPQWPKGLFLEILLIKIRLYCEAS